MGDTLKKVRSGDPLRIPAATFNIFVDADAKSPTLRSLGEEGAIVKKPMAVHIEKVYEEGDFTGLGIGT